MAVAPAYTNPIDGRIPPSMSDSSLKAAFRSGVVGAADTYATGGFTLTAAQLGLASIDWCSVVCFSTGHWGVYVPATGKVKVFSAAATELANASTALQSATFSLHAFGR